MPFPESVFALDVWDIIMSFPLLTDDVFGEKNEGEVE